MKTGIKLNTSGLKCARGILLAISLGAVMGGPEITLAGELWRVIAQHFPNNDACPFLNVVFHFPGSIIKPPFQGLRTAKFSLKQKGFMIQAAVPEAIASSQKETEIYNYFFDVIEQAIEMSRPRWEKHQIAFPFNEAYTELTKARSNLL